MYMHYKQNCGKVQIIKLNKDGQCICTFSHYDCENAKLIQWCFTGNITTDKDKDHKKERSENKVPCLALVLQVTPEN